jgi:uncharacterized membrane protein YgdD (TMEM256/DUF423 family)
MIFWFRTSCFLVALAIVAGAFGAHGLKARFDAYSLSVYDKAVYYQFVNALGMLAICLAPAAQLLTIKRAVRALTFIFVGTLIFSGSLYLLAISGMRWLGAITPLGGSIMILGWLYLAIGGSARGSSPVAPLHRQ